jgi:dCMP deaminase
MINERLTWPEYAMELAKAAALRSEDPYRKVGACILRYDNTVAAIGYNGAPPGVEINWSDRDERRRRVSHAESAALRYIKPHEAK